jgi:hypothetical protein
MVPSLQLPDAPARSGLDERKTAMSGREWRRTTIQAGAAKIIRKSGEEARCKPARARGGDEAQQRGDQDDE